MPTFPSGVQTCQIAFGKGVSPIGSNQAAKLSVELVAGDLSAVVWAADGTPLLKLIDAATADVDTFGYVTVPVVDQAGWIDGTGAPYTMWAYKLKENVGRLERTKYVQPVVGQSALDFDMIPDGVVGLPVSAPMVPVTSVAGKTGAVEIDATDVGAVPNTSEGRTALFESAEGIATFVPLWKPLTAYTAGQQVTAPNGNVVSAITGFTSGATYSDANWRIGTDPSNAPVAKPSSDTRAGVWEYTHNSGTGYLFHLLAGSSFANPASLIALGLDNGNGGGLLVANKKSGVGITIRQQATINAADAYGLKVEGLSTVAPSIRIEQNVDGAADAMQLLAFGTPTAAQRLLLVSAGGGNAGFIAAADGRIEWSRNIRARDNGGTGVGFHAGENSSYATWGDVAGYWSRFNKKGATFWSPTGGGSLYAFKWEAGGSYFQLFTSAAGAYGAEPSTSVIRFQHDKLAFFAATPLKKTGWATPTGTKTRTTFSSDSVTLPELAARVAALLDDLHATAGYGLLNT